MKNVPLAWVLVLGLSGCAGLADHVAGFSDDMAVAARERKHEQLLAATEAKYGSVDKYPPQFVFPAYCASAYLAKRYDKLQNCLVEYERRRNALGDPKLLQDPRNCIVRFMKDSVAPQAACRIYKTETHLRMTFALDVGDYPQAISSAAWLDATKVTGSGGNFDPIDQAVDALGVLVVANVLAGNASVARTYLERLEAFPPGNLGPEIHWLRLKRTWLVRSYMALGDFERAYAEAQKPEFFGSMQRAIQQGVITLTMGVALRDQDTAEAIGHQFVFHKAQLETGRVQEAKAGFDQMLTIPAVRANGDIVWLILYDRGRIAEREAQMRDAAEFYRAAADVIDAQRSTLNTETSKIGFVGSRQAVYRDLVRVLMSQGQSAAAFEYVERSKARALVDMLAGKRDFGVAEANPERVRELLAAVDSAEMTARSVDSSGSVDQRRALVAKTRQELASQAPELSSLVSVSALKTAEIQMALPKDETLVEYYYAGDDLYIFVVTRDRVSGIRTNTARLDVDVQAFRRSLQSNDSGWKVYAVRLHDQLVRPVRAQLRSTNVTIVAHGALHYLPFNALHDGSRFVVEDYSIRMLPAATVLKFLKPAGKDKPGVLLAFGNPDLKDPRFDLAFAQAEAQSIVRVLPKSRALTRADATKTAFRKYATDFQMLHIASHGEFDAGKPLESSLLLAPDAGNDGRLTVGDLYSMRVDADLVTLSACETGLGKIANGDDVVGLTRGFLYAGASTIVASLWQVDDRATGELMTAFYDSLAKRMGKRDSLRAAQIGFLRTQPHPYFWAAFQLTGSP